MNNRPPRKGPLHELESWLTSAPGRDVRIEFERGGFVVHFSERCRDGFEYRGYCKGTSIGAALTCGLERVRTDVEFLRSEARHS